jgi:hypothetical protein
MWSGRAACQPPVLSSIQTDSGKDTFKPSMECRPSAISPMATVFIQVPWSPGCRLSRISRTPDSSGKAAATAANLFAAGCLSGFLRGYCESALVHGAGAHCAGCAGPVCRARAASVRRSHVADAAVGSVRRCTR